MILAWICLLPFTATYFIIKSNRLNTSKKVLIIIFIWVAFFVMYGIADTENEKDKRNKIITCYSEDIYDKLDKLIGIENIYGSFSSNDCNNLNLEDKEIKKITIEVDSLNNLKAIRIDDKYIYNTPEKLYD